MFNYNPARHHTKSHDQGCEYLPEPSQILVGRGRAVTHGLRQSNNINQNPIPIPKAHGVNSKPMLNLEGVRFAPMPYSFILMFGLPLKPL